MRFAPIAIVGRSCLFPGADSPAALWEAVRAGRDLLSDTPEGRWRLDSAHVVRDGGDPQDATWTTRGGYVRGFDEVFDPSGFLVDPAVLKGLDPLFLWVLHTARAALRDAGIEGLGHRRTGAIFGNLSYPSGEMARFAEAVWSDTARPDARNRFMSGRPAQLLDRALGLGVSSFALDAACASSLYAIKLACDALHDGRADVMLAGAVNRADDLFIHVGFTALNALSPTGQSRPFDQAADGLIPAEGAGFVVLKRLADARRDGDVIHGVIRAVGLSNDGRGGGLLAPSKDGQVRAMRAAYEMSGLQPTDISVVECHATGTPVGDGVEVASTAEVFAEHPGVGIGSLKSNLGHLVTAAGVAGLVKVLEAMRVGEYPPTRPAATPLDGLDGPLHLLTTPAPWIGPKRAAVSAFGFGGNNAHLIVEADHPEIPVEVSPVAHETVAVVGLGASVGEAEGLEAFTAALFSGRETRRMDAVQLPLKGLRFPPNDLVQTLPQQTALLRTAIEAAGALQAAPRVGVIVGMGTDPNVCRYGMRWRLAQTISDATALAAARDAVVAPLTSAGVVGHMPNIVANRLNGQLDLGGASFAVSAEAASGLVALTLAARAVATGELDEALVGAVDLCCDPVHEAALAALNDTRAPGDAALTLRICRLSDARAQGLRIYAVLDPATEASVMTEDSLVAQFGHAHVAVGLLNVVASALSLHHKRATGARIEVGGWRVGLKATDDATEAAPKLDGPWLTLAAHQRAPSTAQVMAPAPALPSVHTVHHVEEVRVVTPAPMDPTPQRRHARPNAALSHMQAQMATLATVHRAHLAQQDALHQQFLAVQAQGLAALQTRRMGSSSSPRMLPAAAAPALASPTYAPVLPAAPAAPATPVPAPSVPAPSPKTVTAPKSTTLWDRDQLEVHAGGQISKVFGPMFERQDGYARQVRMPMPPLLLADRVMDIDAAPGELGIGTIWTETDVRRDAWYAHQGVMPAGIMIESGQADLMLISYMGIDFKNRGDRVYRLLACDLTYSGGLPHDGDTLRYDIHVDGHAQHGDVRLFFFHYDCKVDQDVRLSVRGGQAGFFTDEELADSAGVLWDAAQASTASPHLLPAPDFEVPSSLDAAALDAIEAGEPWRAFGDALTATKAHTRTPRIAGGQMRLLGEVTHLSPRGGPWGRGYLRAETPIRPDDWYFTGHFKNDPCMPGTLMFEGCLQTMAIYLMSLGLTTTRDGWRFEPVPDVSYHLNCRGQATPASKGIVYEMFVDEIYVEDGCPTLFADILCTVDGLKAFHTERMGLRLVPDWPMTDMRGVDTTATGPVAVTQGMPLDYRAMLASAWGKPSEAFGPMYRPFDGPRKVARLPGPPYHFMSRVSLLEGEANSMKAGTVIEIVYDVPPDAWYFAENGHRTMPQCVLLEAALQPCGWLASFVGSALTVDEDLSFRNLDGTGTLHAELLPDVGALRTRAEIKSISSSGGMIIEAFEVTVWAGALCVYTMDTVFGFFPQAALDNQVGLPTDTTQRALLTASCDATVDLAPMRTGTARLANPTLLMIDRVTGWWPDGGEAGLGRARAEKDVDPGEWFFKAHFFQDPVQPGSLGIEALLQLLQVAMLEKGLAEPGTRFEPIALGEALTWRYRGQVLLTNEVIITTIDLTRIERDERGVTAWADGSLWVDGKRIYEAQNLAMRIV